MSILWGHKVNTDIAAKSLQSRKTAIHDHIKRVIIRHANKIMVRKT